uniref:Uncharacterized protein n=1 Tax=viral metagenome TaxID=1070528 RepID=A0A6C0KYX6_9ZZZZ|tara:strand:- start:1247 stop:5527 length:4281 start_codon:yes stop_codon:yes gene_type:complete
MSTTSTYIKFYQIEGGIDLQNRVTAFEEMISNGEIVTNESSAIVGVFQKNLMIGFIDNSSYYDADTDPSLVLEVDGTALFHTDVKIRGNTIFGTETSNAEDVSNNDTNLYVYGDLRIMDGGNLVIEDISNTTITELRTEVQITDSIDVSNDGTSVAMTVNQIHTNTQDIVQFQDSGVNVFTIGHNGKSFIQGDVSMASSLEVSNNLLVHNEMFVDQDVSLGGHLQVAGDVSMESSLEVSNNLVVHNEMFVDKEVSFGSQLFVSGDVSFNSTVEISGLMITDKNFILQTDTTERLIIDTSNITLLNSDPSYSALDISATSALRIPVGTQEQRPSIQITGQIRYNTFTKQFEGYGDTGQWQGLGGIVDVDQDTFILAETQPDADNDQIQIFTASYERMKVDASGNIQMINSDPSYSALDISATSALKIPVGTELQRPSIQISGQIRYNTDTKQFEGYGDTGKWQGLGGIIDVDQDTFILAETQPDADNDQIQIFTASYERMKIDACGNIQMFDSNSSYSALDISATSSLAIPRGNINERPTTNSSAPRSLRFNSDTSLCEVYTESNIWSGIPVYKAEQPPALLNISQVKLSESVTVKWEKFADIYKDVFDGKCYPIYLQTFVDISFTDINSTSSNGWETIIIRPGNYDESGNITTPLTTFEFNSVVDTTYSNDTGYDISFDNKPDTNNTFKLPVFTQDDSFDLRIYGVNKSGTTPNYIYIYNVELKKTGAPGEVDVIEFESFGKTDFDVDLSFALDSNDAAITSGISITNYDVSFTLSGTKSLEDRNHSGNQYTNWTNATSLSKSDIYISGLFPGAQYDIQVRAQNALRLDTTSTTGYMYGEYGDVFTSSGFTNNNGGNNNTGTSTTEYIDTSDLNTVGHDDLLIPLDNTRSINCYVNGSNSRSNRTICNSTSYIDISGTSKFYVNYGLQGTDMSGVDDLVRATVELKKNNTSVSSQTITYNGTNAPSAVPQQSIDISNSGSTFYRFSSGGAYNDEFKTSNYNEGFVYSSTLSRTDSNELNTIFVENFPASTDYYYLSYTISSQTNNNSERIDKNGNTSASRNTGNFYVDDYSSTPTITWTQSPAISVTESTVLFGIPSVSSVNLQYAVDVSNFANHIIPTVGNVHSYVAGISKNSYSFGQQNKNGVYTNDTYPITFNSTYSDITSAYDDTTTSDVTLYVYYLDNSDNSPTIATYTNNDEDVSDIGHIFKDTVTTYSAFSLYTFNGSDSIGTSVIVPYHIDFMNTYSSDISSMLLYFNDRFVTGGYSANYSSTSITPFSDWSSSGGGYAVDGPNYSGYSNTGINGFKWIVLDVTSKKSGNTVSLTNFLINGIYPVLDQFGVTDNQDGYEAYIYQDDEKFGTLRTAHNTGATSWFGSSYYDNISNANSSSANGVLQSNGIDAFVDSNHGGSVFLIVGLAQNQNSYFTFS